MICIDKGRVNGIPGVCIDTLMRWRVQKWTRTRRFASVVFDSQREVGVAMQRGIQKFFSVFRFGMMVRM